MARNSIAIAILADAAQARREIRSTTSEVNAAAKQWKLAGGAIKEFMGGLAAGFTVGGLVEFGKQAVSAASDYESAARKVATIFGDQADSITTWAEGAAKSVGLSAQAALDAAGQFGNMFQQLGIGRRQATQMSTSMVQMAADFAAFNHLPTADVLEAIQAAFRGEYDSLQRVIPGITAARIQHDALQLSGKKTAAQLTAADQAMAVQAILARDGAAAMGAYARNSDTLAVKQQTLAAEWDNVKAKFGQALLPAATSAVQKLSDLTEGMAQHAGTIKKVVDATAAVVSNPWLQGAVAAYTSLVVVQGAYAAATAIAARVTTAAAAAQTALANASLAVTGTTASVAAAQADLAAIEGAGVTVAEAAAAAQAALLANLDAELPVLLSVAEASAAVTEAQAAMTAATAAATAGVAEETAAAGALLGVLTKIGVVGTTLAGAGVGFGLGTVLDKTLHLSDKLSDAWTWVTTLGGARTEAEDAQLRADVSAAKLAAKQTKLARDARAWVEATRGKATADLMSDADAIQVYTQAMHGGVAKVKEWTAAQKEKAAADKAAAKAAKEDAAVAKKVAYTQINNAALQHMQQLKKQLDEARQHVEDLVRQEKDYADQLADAVKGGSITQIPLVRAIASLDGRVVNVTTGIKAFRDGLAARLKSARDFIANMNALKAKGVSGDILQQLAAAGPDQGGALAAALRGASAAQIREINGLQSQLTGTANQFGQDFAAKIYGPQIAAAQAAVAKLEQQSADAVKAWIKSLSDLWQKGGGDLAKQLFQAGVGIADGLVEGIASQKDAITAQANDLVNWLLTIKTRLGISSPSRVFAAIGRDVGLGLAGGVDSTSSVVQASMARLTSSLGDGVQLPKLQLLQGGRSGQTVYRIDVKVPVGADHAETGRQIVRAIEAHERQTGVRRLAS